MWGINWGTSTSAPRKTNTPIEEKIRQVLSEDERFVDRYANLRSMSNGYYHYEHKRIVHRKEIRLPEVIMQNFTLADRINYMGLFPEINRAWLTMDKKLYLWDYGHQERFIRVQPIHSVISAVQLVKPKKNIFPKDVKYVLVVATTLEIVLFYLRFERGINSEMNAVRTEFRVPANDKLITNIVSTSSGRIFLSGEGNVYECEYEVGDSLGRRRRKCRKINRTQSIWQKFADFTLPTIISKPGKEEHIIDIFVHETEAYTWLFTLTQKGIIRSYKTTDANPSVYRHAEVSNVVSNAKRTTSSVSTFRNEDVTIVKIMAVSSGESQVAMCIALTSKGDRIFLDQNLNVLFIRVRCPQIDLQLGLGRKGHEPSCTLNSPKDVQPKSMYKDGITVLTDNRYSTHDVLIFICRTYNKVDNKLLELVQSEKLGELTRIRAVAEIPLRNFANFAAWSLYSTKERIKPQGKGKPLEGLSAFATEHAYEKGRRFVVLSSHKLDIYEHIRCVDELGELLQGKKPLADFVKVYGPEETLTMLLTIACENRLGRSQDFQNPQVAIGGGTSRVEQSTSQRNNSGLPSVSMGSSLYSQAAVAPADSFAMTESLNFKVPAPGLEQLAQDLFFDPQFTNPPPMVVPGSGKTVARTWRLEAMSRHFARLVRCVWEMPLCIFVAKRATGKLTQKLRWSKLVLDRLLGPIRFFESLALHHRNRILQYPQVPPNQSNLHLQHQFQEEYNLLDGLLKQVRKTVEGFYVLQKMAEPYMFTPVIERASSDFQRRFSKLTFQELVNTDSGVKMARNFIKLMIECQIDDDRGWVDELNRTCPTFFNNSDLLSFQANIHLKQISSVVPNDEKNNKLLESSLSKFKTACEDRHFDLEKACLEFCKKGSFYAAVDLALHASQHRVTEQQKVQPGQVQVGRSVEKCWLEVWKVLKMLGIGPEKFTVPRVGDFDEQMLLSQRNRVIKRCLACRDQQFLHAMFLVFFEDGDKLTLLFDYPNSRSVMLWLCDQNFFRTNNMKKRVNLTMVYFTRTKQWREKMDFVDKILSQQNKKNQNMCLDLSDQIHLLMEAQDAAEKLAAEPNADPEAHQYATLYQERIQIAQIQQQIVKELNEQKDREYDRQIEQDLRHRIFNVNQLYRFSNSNALWGCALECIRFAGASHETVSVQRIWMCIINEEIEKCGFGKNSPANSMVPWKDAVLKELRQKGSRYIKSVTDHWLFPLQHILQWLEHSAEMYQVRGMEVKPEEMMRQLSVDWSDLLEAYIKIVQGVSAAPPRGGTDAKVQVRVVKSIIRLCTWMYDDQDLQSLANQDDLNPTVEPYDIDASTESLLYHGRTLILNCRAMLNRIMLDDQKLKDELRDELEKLLQKFEKTNIR